MGFRTEDRDHGFRRISTVTKWLAAGAVGLVGVFSAWAAGAIPGRNGVASTPSTPSTPDDSGGATATTQAPARSDDGLQRPTQPPVQSPVPHRVRSGGS